MTAAALSPSSSPPSTASDGFPDTPNAATSPSPGLSAPAPSDEAVVPDPANAAAPTKTAGFADPLSALAVAAAPGFTWTLSRGRSIADVSKPRRAATSAAAASSAALGDSGRTI